MPSEKMFTPGAINRQSKRLPMPVAGSDHPIYKRGFVIGIKKKLGKKKAR